GAGYAFPHPWSKALRVHGSGSSKPVIVYNAATSCPRGQVLVFDNLEFRAGQRGFFAAIEFSDGTVVFSRCDFPPLNSEPFAVWLSHRVVLIDCDIQSRTMSVSASSTDMLLLNCRTESWWAPPTSGGGVSMFNSVSHPNG